MQFSFSILCFSSSISFFTERALKILTSEVLAVVEVLDEYKNILLFCISALIAYVLFLKLNKLL